MIFKTLYMENIRSYRRHTIKFPAGTSLFEGDIGSGKSTILMAIEFALFGLGNQKGDSLLRKGAKKGTVYLEFQNEDINYVVHRTLIRKEKNGQVRQGKSLLGIDDEKLHLSPSELKEKILHILNFKEPLNPRSQSVIFRYAVYTPQEEMKFILAQKPDLRLQTLRKAFGIEDYKIAAENATLISRIIKNKMSFLEGQTVDISQKKKELLNLKRIKEDNQKDLSFFIRQGEELENTFNKQKEDLEQLRESELKLKEVRAEIPHLKNQINDKNDLITRYNNEIQEALKENQERLIPQISRIEQIKKPTTESEESLTGKILHLKQIMKERNESGAKLSILKENLQDIENSLGKQGDKTLEELKTLKEGLKEKIHKQSVSINYLQEEIKKISQSIYRLEAKKTDIQDKIENLNGVGDLCPICDSILDDAHKANLKNEREEKINQIDLDIQGLKKAEFRENEELELENRNLEGFKIKLEDLRFIMDKISNLNDLKIKIKVINGNIRNLDEKLALIIEETFEFDHLEDYLNHFEGKLTQLKEFKKSQEDLSNFKYQLKKNKNKIEENKAAIKGLQDDILQLGEDLRGAQENSGKLESILKKIKELNSEHQEITQKFQNIKEKIVSTTTLLNSLKEDISKVSDDIQHKEELRKQLIRLNDYHIWLNDYLIPTLSLIEKQVMRSIHQDFNFNFQKWFRLLMDDPSKTGKINEEFTPIIEQDGFEQDINYLSGGEKTSVALSYRLALNNVVQKVSTGMKSNLMILDEPTDGFSKEQLYKLREILNEINCPQVIIVSHERELESFADHVFRIEKIDGISQVVSMS